MPPKSKKKGVHKIPEEHPHIARNREREKIKAEKKFARILKMSKRLRKQANSAVASSPGGAANIPERVEERECLDENYLPLSSSHQPGTSHAQGQEVSRQIDCIKSKKKTIFDPTCAQEKSPIGTRSVDRKTQKNTSETKQQRSNISSTDQISSQNLSLNYSADEKLHKDQQAKTQLGARSKIGLSDKRTVKEPLVPEKLTTGTSVRAKSDQATQTDDPETQKKLTGIKSDFAETGQISSKTIPLNHVEGVRFHRYETKTQEESRDKKFATKMKANKILKAPKTIDSTKLMRSNINKVPVEVLWKHPEESISKNNSLQKISEKVESGKISLDEYEKQFKSLASIVVSQELDPAVSGIIKVSALNEYDFNGAETPATCTIERWFHIIYKNVEISIFVHEGTQVTCNFRHLVPLDVDDVESCSPTLEGQAIGKSDKDVKSNQEHRDETPNSSNSSSSSKFSKENIPSAYGLNSAQENI